MPIFVVRLHLLGRDVQVNISSQQQEDISPHIPFSTMILK